MDKHHLLFQYAPNGIIPLALVGIDSHQVVTSLWEIADDGLPSSLCDAMLSFGATSSPPETAADYILTIRTNGFDYNYPGFRRPGFWRESNGSISRIYRYNAENNNNRCKHDVAWL